MKQLCESGDVSSGFEEEKLCESVPQAILLCRSSWVHAMRRLAAANSQIGITIGEIMAAHYGK